MVKWLWYWGPVCGYAGLIFFLSSMSNPNERFFFPNIGDKSLHVIEYAILGALCYRAFRWGATEPLSARAFLLAVTASSLYGFSDELHQALVPMRESSWMDAVADVIGSLLGAGLASRLPHGPWTRLFAAPRNRPVS